MSEEVGSHPEVFLYDLPSDRIAQRPIEPPEAAKLLVVDRSKGTLEQSTFADLPKFLNPGDLLVFNNTKVIPARLRGTVEGNPAEILLIRRESTGIWICIGKPLRKIEKAGEIIFQENLRGTVLGQADERSLRIQFSCEGIPESEIDQRIFDSGEMPIPPYIRDGCSDNQDRVDYQPIFAVNVGSVAAPTASLHFTRSLVEQLEDRGVRHDFITLHLGTASFLPVVERDAAGAVSLRPPAEERYVYNSGVIEQIKRARIAGKRVFAVGTSTVRALESMVRNQQMHSEEAESNLFIRPGYRFFALDGIITNFHQPGTTHLLLVEAFLGRKLLQESYHYALENQFRFLSYGDGMLLI